LLAAAFVLGFAGLVALRADSVVVFNEIMYRPLANDTGREWVELHNQMAVNVELSGWALEGAIQYVFSERTIIPGGGYLVVARTPAALAATGVTNVLGPFQGGFQPGGANLQLFNNNRRLMDEVNCDVDGDWPVGADGGGVSLSKRDEESASGSAQNWTVSPLAGGTPGRRNFAATPFEITRNKPLAMGGSWRYDASGADRGTDWRLLSFDDGTWTMGASLFQAGDAPPPAGDPQPVPSLFSTGVGPDGSVLAPGLPDPHYVLTQSAQSTPPPPEIAATVIQGHPAWLANDATSSWLGSVNPGTSDVAAGVYNYRTMFSLDGFDPATASLDMQVGADNQMPNVLLNGVSLGISYVGFSVWSGTFHVSKGFQPGANTLDFLTINDGSGPNPAGFRARLTGLASRQFPVGTPLPQAPITSYFRTPFTVTGPPQQAALTLNGVVADGAVFYVNGVEVLRLNLPEGPVTSSTVALTNVSQPGYTGPFALATSSLVTGTNLLAVEVHRGPGGNPHLLFGTDLSLTTTNILIPPPVTLAFNELSAASSTGFWLELINRGTSPLELAGCVVSHLGPTAAHDFVIPSRSLAAGGFLLLSQATLGFSPAPGDRLLLYGPGRLGVLDAVVVRAESRGRSPDGAGRWWFPTPPTPGASNHFVFHDELVINEIMYAAPGVDAASESWLELHNRSNHVVDLTGWRLGQDIDYPFLPGTSIPGGGYLVVAKDPAYMQAKYPGVPVVGPFTQKLRHSSHLLLLDPAGNPANEVRYFAGKPWPEYPAGGGSSLELRDPWADNSKAEAWAASLEGGRSTWSNHTYTAAASNLSGPTLWNEFAMGLLDAGECLIDDLSVVESPSGTPIQFLQNGNFETGLTTWRALGTHSYSRVEVDPDNPANHVLHLITTGWTYHIHDHLETTYAVNRKVTNGRQYQISFRAKWLAGNNHLNTRLYFNRLARTSLLPMPSSHGTPGSPNSTLVGNIGPTYSTLAHSPVVPEPGVPVTVSVAAGDPQGVRGMALWWSANGGGWKTSPMRPVSPAAEPGYSNYVVVLPGQASGTTVQFFAQGTDGSGAVSAYPAGGTNSRALFKVNDGTPAMPRLHRLRLLMTAADAERLHALTNVMTYDRQALTVIHDESEVFYDVGVHLQSSERGRSDPSRVGFSLKFHPDRLFRGVQDTITLDRSGGYSGRGGRQDEMLLWHAVNHAGGLYGLDCDLAQVFAPRAQENSTAMMRLSAFDSSYWNNQFNHGGNGNQYKLELIYYPLATTTGDPQAPKVPQPDDVINVEIQNLGDNPENYRWAFLQENNADADDYGQVIALNKAFSLSGSALDQQTSQLMDLDEWLRTLAFKAFTGDVDTFTYGLNHNWKIYFRPEDGKALGLLWDMDFSFAQSVNYPSPGNGSANTYKIVTRPNNYRRFYHHLLDIMTTTVNSAYLGPWATHYAGLVGQDWSGALSFLQQRATYLRGLMPRNTPFAIRSNGGQDFSVATDHVTLTGTAPLEIDDVEFNGVRYPLRWTSLTNWSLSVPLPAVINPITALGVDNQGRPMANATATITVTNTGPLAPVPVVINEWMAANSAPGGFPDPLDGHFSDWFELYNPNPVPVDLSGYSLTDTPILPWKWIVPSGTMIAPLGFRLVWADNQTNLNGLDATGDLHAGFKLAKTGTMIGLYGPDGVPQHVLSFGPQDANTSQGLFPDGLTNTVQTMADWTPRSPNRVGDPAMPHVGSIALVPGGGVALTFTVTPGRTYQVEYKDRLDASAWALLGGPRLSPGPQLIIIDAATGLPERFYRLVLVP